MKTLKNVWDRIWNRIRAKDSESADNRQPVDYATKCVNSFGCYQVYLCILASLSRFPAIWTLLSTVFIAPETNFICKEFENVTVDVKNSTCYENCLEYEYYQEVLKTTLITKFGLICDKSWLVKLTVSVMLTGILFGCLFFGWLSDRNGRRVAIRIAYLFNIIFTTTSFFSFNYWVFTTMRFFVGFSSGGMLVTSIIYILEVVGPGYKEIAGSLILFSDGIAIAMTAVYAYYSLTWDIFLFECCVVSALIFGLVLTLPETLRWYVAHGKVERAVQVATEAAKWNIQDVDIIKEGIEDYMKTISTIEQKPKHNFSCIFKQKAIRRKTAVITILLSKAACVHFMINRDLLSASSNVFNFVILLSLFQVAASVLALPLNKLFGRRILLMLVFFANGMSGGALIFFSNKHWSIVFAGVVNHVSIIIALVVLFIHISEFYLTPIRNFAFGLVLSKSMLSVMFTYLMFDSLSTYTSFHLSSHALSILISCVLTFVCIGFCYLLDETKELHLENSIL